MKKILALCLASCFSLAVFSSCKDHHEDPPVVDTTDTQQRKYNVEDAVLISCIGQADENGVYVVPDTIARIGEGAFAGDKTLKEVVIGSHVKSIGSGAFQSCTSLKKVTIEEGVESLGSHAFYSCSALEEVVLPSSIERIEEKTFYGCTSLETLSLGFITAIADSAFSYCTSLDSITLSSALASIGPWAFSQCSKLEDINLEDCKNLVSIGDYAFTGCSRLASVSLPKGIQSVGTLAFYECSRLTDITIPDTLSDVGFSAFTHTPWYQESKADYLIVGDGVLIKCSVNPSFLDLSGRGIRYIGGGAFWNAEANGLSSEYGYKYASELKNIVIPDGVIGIGDSAFSGCIFLEEVSLPDTIEFIDSNAFNVYMDGYEAKLAVSVANCKNLQTIGSYAFYGCMGIKEIVLPESVESIGSYAFAQTAAFDSFMKKSKDAETEDERYLIVGNGILVAAYVADGQTGIHVPEGVRVIAGSAFCGWDSSLVPEEDADFSIPGRSKYNITNHVTELTLPSTLRVIGDSAFFRMACVKKIVLPDALDSIGVDAFAFCTALSDLSGGPSLRVIGDGAFRYCTSIKSFHFSENTKKIGSSVFYGCSALQSVYFPTTLTDIGADLFSEECTALSVIWVSEDARARVYALFGNAPVDVKISYYVEGE